MSTPVPNGEALSFIFSQDPASFVFSLSPAAVLGEGGASDHGDLTGLSDDDHPQYHNDTRGDARYSLLGHTHSNAGASAGFMSSADKAKLDGIATGATANDTNANLRARATHTGTQATSTIDGLDAALATKLDDVAAGTDAEIVGANAAGTVLQRLGYTITTLLAAAYARASHTGTQLAATISDFASSVLTAIGARSVLTTHSLTGGGDLSADRTLSLVGDTASPGNSKIYGTNASGVRGWYDAPSGASPGGSGSELQYRGSSTTFSAASGTHWDSTNGRLSIGAGTSPAGVLHVACDSASEVVGIFQGAASQTANIIQTRNSSGTVLTAIAATGHVLLAEQQTVSLRGDPAGLGDYGLVYSSSLDATCLFGYSGRKLALGFRGYNFGAFTAFFTLDDANDSWTAANGVNYAFGTSTGSKFGTSTSQKLGFWNATPIVQPASANQAAITDTAGATYTSAEQTMLGNLKTLVNQLRADLVSAGLIKGSA